MASGTLSSDAKTISQAEEASRPRSDAGFSSKIAGALQAGDEVATFHEAHGLRLEHMELSSELSARLLPGLAQSAVTILFSEDGLVRLQVK
jgi:hypothetical protein